VAKTIRIGKYINNENDVIVVFEVTDKNGNKRTVEVNFGSVDLYGKEDLEHL